MSAIKKRKLGVNINSVECVWLKIFEFLATDYKPCRMFAALSFVQKAWKLQYFSSLLVPFDLPIQALSHLPTLCMEEKLSIECNRFMFERHVFKNCLALKTLTLQDAKRIDLSCLINCHSLTLASCENMRLPNNLKSLHLDGTKFEDADLYTNPMTNLQILHIGNNLNHSQLHALQHFSKLEELHLTEMYLARAVNMELLQYCVNLKELYFDDQETTVTGLQYCKQITKLTCSLRCTNIDEIKEMTNLQYLILHNWNDSQDLTKLKRLNLLQLVLRQKKNNIASATYGLTCHLIVD